MLKLTEDSYFFLIQKGEHFFDSRIDENEVYFTSFFVESSLDFVGDDMGLLSTIVYFCGGIKDGEMFTPKLIVDTMGIYSMEKCIESLERMINEFNWVDVQDHYFTIDYNKMFHSFKDAYRGPFSCAGID